MNFGYKGLFVENVHIVAGLSPSADIYNGNPASDVVNMKNFAKAVFLLHQCKNATSTTGTATVKAQAVTSVAASNATDLPFKYSKKATGAADTMGAVTSVAAGSTFTTTANEDTIYAIEVDARDLPSTSQYVQLKLTESVNAPVIGSVICLLLGYKMGYPFDTALT